LGLLVAAAVGVALFATVETRAPSPLIRLAFFRDMNFSAALAMNALVATVMMATLVVGPFYLSRALGLNAAEVGLVVSIVPVVSAVSGVVAGRIVDRMGAVTVTAFGLVQMALGAAGLALLPSFFGTTGYVAAILVLTPGYQLFQAANNTAVMADVPADR